MMQPSFSLLLILLSHQCSTFAQTTGSTEDISRVQLQLVCGTNEMKASLDKSHLEKLGFKTIIMHLNDKHCAGFEEEQKNKILVSVVTMTRKGQCGTQLTRNKTHAMYSNTLYFANGHMVRERETKINFHCSYPLDMETSLETAVHPMVSSANISDGGTDSFTVKMAIYRDPHYTSPYEGSMAVLSSQDRLHVGVMVNRGDMSQFVLRMENCYATPTSKAFDLVKYEIIHKGCSSEADQTTEVLQNGVSAQGRFSVQVFKLITKHYHVFLHCEIRVCDMRTEDCKPHCSVIKRRRAAAIESDNLFHLGPIVREDVPKGAATSHGFQGAWMTLLILAVLGFSLHAFP